MILTSNGTSKWFHFCASESTVKKSKRSFTEVPTATWGSWSSGKNAPQKEKRLKSWWTSKKPEIFWAKLVKSFLNLSFGVILLEKKTFSFSTGWKMSYPPTITYFSPKQEVRKIIDSKVPAGIGGYVSSHNCDKFEFSPPFGGITKKNTMKSWLVSDWLDPYLVVY